jgi:phosphoglycerate dehydrogenase-like enzyme
MDPHPRRIEPIFSDSDRHRLEALGQVIWHEGGPAGDQHVNRHLPETVALIGQTPMPKERLDRAPKLRAICNIEGNFLPNIDYAECHRRNIHVLVCAPAFAPAVAEMALGLAIAAAREIVPADAGFREGNETYGARSNLDCYVLSGSTLGLIGFGNIGKCLLGLLRPFCERAGQILVHDPWQHEHVIESCGVTATTLNDLLARSRVVFVMSAATTENRAGLRAEQFAMMQPGSVLVLVGRSDVVDFDALVDAAASGHIRAAIDVFPQEPMPADHPIRRTPNTILSPHRAGSLPQTYRLIGQMVVDDLELVLRGLPPQRMQRATPELANRYRSRPIK